MSEWIKALTFVFERDPQAERDTGLVLVSDLMVAGPEPKPKLTKHLIEYLTKLNRDGELPEKNFGWWPNDCPPNADALADNAAIMEAWVARAHKLRIRIDHRDTRHALH